MCLDDVPKRYRRYTRESWEARWGSWDSQRLVSLTGRNWTLAEISETFIGDEGIWLLALYGLHGRRKTSLGTSVFFEAMATGMSGMWVDAETWLREQHLGIKERPGVQNWRSADQSLLESQGVDMLLMDDVGAVHTRGWAVDQLSLLLRHREAEIKKTILISNAEDSRAFEELNHSLPSRIGSTPLQFKLEGNDYRLEARDGRTSRSGFATGDRERDLPPGDRFSLGATRG